MAVAVVLLVTVVPVAVAMPVPVVYKRRGNTINNSPRRNSKEGGDGVAG